MQHHRNSRSKNWFGLVATIIRRDTLLEHGFDAAFASGEDIEFRWRLARAGLKLGVSHADDRRRIATATRSTSRRASSSQTAQGLGRMVAKHPVRGARLLALPRGRSRPRLRARADAARAPLAAVLRPLRGLQLRRHGLRDREEAHLPVSRTPETARPLPPETVAIEPPAPTGIRAPLGMLENALGLVGSKLATLGLGYFAWIVAARLWPASDVGLAAAAVSAMMLCVQLGLIGAGSAVISHFPEYKTRPSDLLDPAITVVIGASLAIAAIFLGVAAVGLSHLASIAHSPIEVLLFFALCVTGTLGVLLDQLSVALRRTDQAVVRGTASGIVTLALLAPAAILWRHDGTLAILAAWTVGGIVPCLIGIVQVRRSIPGYRFTPRFAGLGPLIATGLPNFALTVAERAPGPILPIIATEALSPASNAYWYSAWMVAWVVYWIPISVGMTLFAEASHSPEGLQDHVRTARRHALLLGCGSALVVALLAHPILALLGHGYAAHGTWALRVLTLAVVPGTFIQLYFGSCRARRALKEGIVVGTSAGLVGLGVAAALGSRYGLVGHGLGVGRRAVGRGHVRVRAPAAGDGLRGRAAGSPERRRGRGRQRADARPLPLPLAPHGARAGARRRARADARVRDGRGPRWRRATSRRSCCARWRRPPPAAGATSWWDCSAAASSRRRW